MKVSKTLQEVWRWKEEVARDTKDMSMSEQIAYFRQASQRLAEKTGKKLDLLRASRRGK
jgi:hypothetical protein